MDYDFFDDVVGLPVKSFFPKDMSAEIASGWHRKQEQT
jgi:hypothetical protein